MKSSKRILLCLILILVLTFGGVAGFYVYDNRSNVKNWINNQQEEIYDQKEDLKTKYKIEIAELRSRLLVIIDEKNSTYNELLIEKQTSLDLQSQLIDAKQQVLNGSVEHNKLLKDLEEKNNQVIQLENAISEKNSEIDNANNELEIANSTIERLQSENSSKEELIGTLNSQIQQNETTIAELQSNAEQNAAEIQRLLSENSQKQSQITELQGEVSSNKTIIINLTQQVEEKETEIENLQSELTAKQQELDDLRNGDVANLTQQVEDLQSQLFSQSEEVQRLTCVVETQKAKVAELESTIEENNAEIERLYAEISRLQKELDEKVETIADLMKQVEQLNSTISGLNSTIKDLQADVETKKSTITELQADNLTKTNTITELQGTISTLQSQITELENDEENHIVELNSLRQQVATMQTSITDLQSTIADNEKKIQDLQIEVSDKDKQIVLLNSLVSDKSSQIEQLNAQLKMYQSVLSHTSLQEYSYDEIDFVSTNGYAPILLNVGDEITFNLTTDEEITFVILGFDHDDLTSGGKAGISFGMKNLLATKYAMNSSNTNVGGWDTSLMRTDTMKTLLSQLPADLQKVIKAVNKKASAGNKTTTITTSSDKLWLLSVAEISSKAGLTASLSSNLKDNASTYGAEGEQYEYFKNAIGDADIYKSQTALVKNLSNGTGSAYNWWLRSPGVTDATSFWYILSSGYAFRDNAISACGVAFGFCV